MTRHHWLLSLGLAALLLTGCSSSPAPTPRSFEQANQAAETGAQVTPTPTPVLPATAQPADPPETAPTGSADLTALQQQIAQLQADKTQLQADKSQLQTEKAGLEKRLQEAAKASPTSTLGQFQIQLGLTSTLLSEHLWGGLAAGNLAYDLTQPQVALQLDGDDGKPVLQATAGPKAGEWDVAKLWAKNHADVKQVGVLKITDPNLQTTYLRVTDDKFLEMRWQFGRLAALHLNTVGPDMGSVEWTTPQ